MPITWDEIKTKIDFPDKDNLLYQTAYNALENKPGDNFTTADKDKILLSLKLLFEFSDSARDTLSNFFQNSDLNVMRAADGSGSKHNLSNPFYADTIFIDLEDPGRYYLNLSGELSQVSLGFVVYHEFLHSFDKIQDIPPPPVEIGQRDYTNPTFDHLGSVVRRTNEVREEVLAKLKDPNFVLLIGILGTTDPLELQIIQSFLNEGIEGDYSSGKKLELVGNSTFPTFKDYVISLGVDIHGQYDQSILFRTGESQAVFTSDGAMTDDHPNRDLVISLQQNNKISTGDGDDVIVGARGGDFIFAGGDNDTIFGKGGEDTLFGGSGTDYIYGNGGLDTLYGGRDNDFLYGGLDADNYHIARSGDGVDTITDEDGDGLIILGGGDLIIGTAVPVSGGTDNKQLYELQNNNTQVIKLEYDPATKILNIYDWNNKIAGDEIIINDFESGDLHIHLAEEIITPPPPDPTPEPTPDPIPDPVTDGSPDSLLSVQVVNQTIDVGTRIPLLSLFPLSGWVDNDGVNDIESFAVADRTLGGGYLERAGVRAQDGKVYDEIAVTDIINWWFVGGPNASVDEIGFNIVQANGDYSPRLNPGAIVTTVVPTEPAPDPDPEPINPINGPSSTSGGSNLAALSFSSTSTGASSGGSVEVIYTVKNIGDARSARGAADIVLAYDSDLQTGRKVSDSFSITELNPGEQRTYNRTVDVPISGNGSFFLGVDVRSVSLGHNLIESDDTASIPFQIGPGLSGDPDLRPGFSDPDKIFSQGIANTIDFTISTNANGSPPYDYRVLLSKDKNASSDDIVLLDKSTSSGLGYIGTHYYNNTAITIPNYVQDGLYYLIVSADPFAKISETREDNNTRDRMISVVSRPADDNELPNIVGSHIVVEADTMDVENPYKISAYGYMDSIDDPVNASADGPLIPFTVRQYLSEDNIFDKSDIPFRKSTELIQQPVGQIFSVNDIFPLPKWIDSGDYYLFTLFDTDNEITEDIESDNVTSGTNVTIINNITRTVSAGDDAIDLFEGKTLTVDIQSNDTSSINQDMVVRWFEGDYVNDNEPFVGRTKSGLSYSISVDGTLSLDASTLNFDIQPGEVRTETFRYELRGLSDSSSDLGVVNIKIRDPESDTIKVSPNGATVKESDGKIDFTITRSGDRVNSEETLYISTTQEYGSVNNSDYTELLKEPIIFGVGEVDKVITVNISADDVTEFDETFGLIVQTDPIHPTSTFFTSTVFTIQDTTTVTGIKRIGDEIAFDATSQINQMHPLIVALSDGNFLISWFDFDNSSVKAQLLDINGNKIGNEILVDDNAISILTNPKITVLDNGGFVITWPDSNPDGDRDIKAQLFAAHGNKIGGEILVNTATQSSPFGQHIEALPGAGFVITWVDFSHGVGGAEGDSSDTAIKAQVFSANGDKIGTEILVNTATQNFQHEPEIAALPEGGFVVTWMDESQRVDSTSGDTSGSAIKAQVFSADGNKIGDEILVNTATQNGRGDTQITALSNGGFAITWNDSSQGDSDGSINAQIFNADGGKIGEEILVNTATQNGQHYPMITGLPDGGFVITWMDFSHGNGGATGDSSGIAIKAQIFNAEGGKTGEEILVNTATENDQSFSQITTLPNGGFVITWIDDSQGVGGASGDSSDSAIKAQAFAADGSKIGDEILVNTATLNDQRNPQVTSLPDGSFAITWEDNGEVVEDGGLLSLTSYLFGYSIKAQVFKTTGGSMTTNPISDSIVVIDGNQETITLADGNKLVWGSPDTLDGTNIENFKTGDTLFISGVELQQSDLSVAKGSAILSLDTDNDELSDTVITLEGDYRLESFIVAGVSTSGSYILYLGNDMPVGEDDNFSTLPEGFVTDEDHNFTTANVLANDNDGDGDTLFVSSFDTSSAVGLVTDNGDGTFNYDPNGAFEYLKSGETTTDSFIYTVSDGNGGFDTAMVTVTIDGVNDAPTGSPAGQLANGEEDKVYNIFEDDLLAGFSDVDGDTLHVTGLTINHGVLGTFDSTNRSWSFTPDQDYNGSVDLTYGITDGNGGDLTGINRSFILDPVNDTPQAGDDHGEVFEDSTVTVTFAQLLANDVDVDGTSQTIIGIDTTNSRGSVVIDAINQTITYSADADEFDLLAPGNSTTDTFKYTLQGSTGETATATVSISVIGVDDGIELFGTVQPDTLTGTDGEDVIKGDNGDDAINGGEGADELFGENGNDTLIGGNSIDTLFGGNGNDNLDGGAGNDWLGGDKGDDILTGGQGYDVYLFAKFGGKDIILDFENGIDKIQIAADTDITEFSQLSITEGLYNGSIVYTTLDLGKGGQVILAGVSSVDVDATDFIFPG